MRKPRPPLIHGDAAITWASYIIGTLHEEDGLSFQETLEYFDIDYMGKIGSPCKKTILHDYIENQILDSYTYLLGKHFPKEVISDLSEVMSFYGIDISTVGSNGSPSISTSEEQLDDFDDFDELEEYADRVLDLFQAKLLGAISDDVFTILFSDKNLLHDFNIKLAEIVQGLKHEDYPNLLKEDGVINRCDYWPKWLTDGVFYRDKGRCQLCGCDLSRLLNLDNDINIDHIVPLQCGGTNDPTNLQLACEHCNKSKGARGTAFNNIASPFWELDSYTAVE